jgi:hypothetical protein
MLSKGHKIEYRCPECNSVRIAPLAIITQRASGECFDCNTYWPWRSRIKESLKKLKYEARKAAFLNRAT